MRYLTERNGGIMALTVNEAFEEFLRDKVNLDSGDVSSTRSSRNWLESKILGFPSSDADFPTLYEEMNINYGSFARKTKKRPLDDADMMICLSAMGGHYAENFTNITITVPDSASRLKKLCFDNSNTLSSIKVINKFVSSLKTVPQYESAIIKRNQVAATLKLVSYSWNFDIVPSFFTTVDAYGRNYYLIPDGQGNWQRTDPRKDRKRVQDVNQQHDGNVLNVIRVLKYWNKRKTMPTAESYLFENLLLDYYAPSFRAKASSYVDVEIPKVLGHIENGVYNSVYDPKDIQGDLNNLSFDERRRISDRAYSDRLLAEEARRLEDKNDHRGAISKWAQMFGPEFPTYG